MNIYIIGKETIKFVDVFMQNFSMNTIQIVDFVIGDGIISLISVPVTGDNADKLDNMTIRG